MKISPELVKHKNLNYAPTVRVYKLTENVFCVEHSVRGEGDTNLFYSTLEEAVSVFDQINTDYDVFKFTD